MGKYTLSPKKKKKKMHHKRCKAKTKAIANNDRFYSSLFSVAALLDRLVPFSSHIFVLIR